MSRRNVSASSSSTQPRNVSPFPGQDSGAYVPAPIAARLLGLRARTIRNWIDCGTIAGTIERVRSKVFYYVFRPALTARLKAAGLA